MQIRAEAPPDRAAVRSVAAAAFGDEGPLIARLVDALGAAGAVTTSLVADDGGDVVGHVQLTRAWLDARERLVEVPVLSPLSVRPDRQRGGIGRALVAAAVEAAAADGAPAVFLEGDPGYYSRLGFARASDHGFTRPSVRIPDAAFQVVVLPAREPWMTGAVVYAEAFWVLDCVGLRDPVLAAFEAR